MTVNTPQRRRSTSMAALLTATLALAACGSDADDAADTTEAPAVTTADTTVPTTGEPAGDTRTVEAENGSIQIPADPQRIVTIGNTTAPFIDLGGAPIGSTEEGASVLDSMPADQRAIYDSAEKVGLEEIDLEKVASLEPDLILVQFHSSDWDAVGAQLEAIAPTVYWGLSLEWKELADAIAVAGNVTGELDTQKAEFAEKVAAIQETYADIIETTSFVDVSRQDWNDPGAWFVADIGCSEIGRDDVGLNLPEAPEGADPLAYESRTFEQLSELTEYDVITYPVDADGEPVVPFLDVIETNTWQALPAVTEGRAVGVFCPGNGSYGPVLRYLDSLDSALASLPTAG